MKAILIVALLAGTAAAAPIATASPQGLRTHERDEVRAYVALEAAHEQIAYTRKEWEKAIAGDHPIAAGTWARRHFEALQARRAAYARWRTAAQEVSAALNAR